MHTTAKRGQWKWHELPRLARPLNVKRLLLEVSNISAPRAQSTRQRAPPPSFLKWYAVCTGSEISSQKLKIVSTTCKPASDRQKLTLLLASVVGIGLKYLLMTCSWDARLAFVFGGSCGCKAKNIWNFGLPVSAKPQKSATVVVSYHPPSLVS